MQHPDVVPAAAPAAAPTLRASQRALQRLARGHLWVYRSDLVGPATAPAGQVRLADEAGKPFGWAWHSPASTIALRLVSRAAAAPDVGPLIAQRLAAAQARRAQLLPGVDGVRLVHGEADLLPGMFVDRYGDALALQTTCGGADVYLDELVAAARQVFGPGRIALRQDSAARRREGLPAYVRLLGADGREAGPATPRLARYTEGRLVREVDLVGGQKTGSYLDQRDNHLRVGALARGDCLDCFTYQGGFACQMAARGQPVTACDQSAAALQAARQVALRAELQVDFVQADVMEMLPAMVREGRRFDTVVLDPPAFASTQRTVPAASRAYREINRRALQLLRPHGLLVTCSCSGRLTPADFEAIVGAAARAAGRRLHAVGRFGAGPDHPELLEMPETAYLKCHVYQVL